ncbi:O-acetyltransferase PaAT-2 [Metarhizium brunneum]|uniref:O-acetyltransferase PaAT-2 n=1 Tax=Metarhizium brunneum TaxID=500148 RepID=A0A7D5UYW2_9HYPO
MGFSCCGRRPKKAGTEKLTPVHDEVVYPVHFLDQSTLQQELVTWVLSFNDVLSAVPLHQSLCTLLEIGDWKKLGTRLRVRNDGLMEAYAPKVFTAQNPPCTFFHEKFFDTPIQRDPIGKHFILPNKRAFTQRYPSDYRGLFLPPGVPSTVQDIVDGGLSQLVLRVLSFRDATMVTLSWPPNSMDTAGFKALLQNWSLCMAGRMDEVATVFGAREDVLEKLVMSAEEKKNLDELRVDRKLKALSQNPISKWWRRRSHKPLQSRMVFIPQAIYDDFMKEIREDIASILEDDDQRPVTTAADIILAWISKLQAAADLKPRGVLSTSLVNLRCRMSTLRDPSGEYIQNLTLPCYSYISPEEATDTIGAIALQHKHNTQDQTSEHQLLALAKHVIDKKKRGKNPLPIYNVSRIPLLEFHNFSPLQLFSAADFSPAVVCADAFDGPRWNPPGRMTAAYYLMESTNFDESVCAVLGKDLGGNFWMTCQLEPEVWVKVEEELYNLQKTVNSPTSGHCIRFYDYSARKVSVRSTF